MTITRREVLRLVAVSGIGSTALARWAAVSADEWKPAVLTAHQDEIVATIAELIIPQTDTPGARAAGVNRFIDAVIADADSADRDAFLAGLESVDRRARELHAVDFVAATPQQQSALLSSIAGSGFFATIKTLTITGYYTSKVGMSQELGDDGRVVFPGYAGCTHPRHKAAT